MLMLLLIQICNNVISLQNVLAGVGVAFYLMLALRAKFRELGIFTAETQPNFY